MQKLTKVNAAKEKLSMVYDREPTLYEIQDETGIKRDDISKVLNVSQLNLTISLDESYSNAEGEVINRMDTIVDKDQPSPEKELDEDGMRDELKNHIQEKIN